MIRNVAIITGASTGIGAATAELLAARGYAVTLASRNLEQLEQVAARIRMRGHEALVVPTDVTQPDDIANMVQRTLDAFGRIDVLVNNAGRGLLAAIADVRAEDLEALWRLNVYAPVYAMQAVLPHMRERGSGAIINVSSVAQFTPYPLGGVYHASKIALAYLSDAARMELSRDHIQVCTVLPRGTVTSFIENRQQSGDLDDLFISDEMNAILNDTSNYDTPEDVAETIWETIQHPRRQVVVKGRSLKNFVSATLFPEVGQARFTWRLNRYIPRLGHTAPSPSADKRKIKQIARGTALSLAATAVAVGASALVKRKKR